MIEETSCWRSSNHPKITIIIIISSFSFFGLINCGLVENGARESRVGGYLVRMLHKVNMAMEVEGRGGYTEGDGRGRGRGGRGSSG